MKCLALFGKNFRLISDWNFMVTLLLLMWCDVIVLVMSVLWFCTNGSFIPLGTFAHGFENGNFLKAQSSTLMCLCLVLHRSLCLYISLSLSPITLSPALSCSPTLDLSCSLLRHLCSYLPMSIKCSLLSSLLRDARSQTGDYSGFCIFASNGSLDTTVCYPPPLILL